MTTSWPNFTRSYTSTVELIIWIVHLINAEYGFKATFIECLIVRYQRKTSNLRLYLLPYFRKDRSVLCIGSAKTMNPAAPIVVIFWLGLDE